MAAIGNFDGVHRGHKFLIEQTIAFADALGAEPGVVVFDPHPRRHFRPDDPPFLLTTPEDRAALIKEAGAPNVMTVTFDGETAAMAAEDFVGRILIDGFGLSGVITGSDFRFGAGRSGDVLMLNDLCAARGVEARIAELLSDGPTSDPYGDKVSSSGVREAIHHGDMDVAAGMLGRPWSVAGFVASGQKLGRQIGFPTANLTLGALIEPRRGVYVVDVEIAGAFHHGVANFGRRPTVGADAPLLETHVFDFEGDLYGQEIRVLFKEFLRDEQKFDGIDALKTQIAKDSADARQRHERARG
ncbi:MAG: bifunctional riboflavin kinase/FAD synthetase [Pseudomonadota bacterium]